MGIRRSRLDIVSCGAKNMKEDNIWGMIEDLISDNSFEVKDKRIIVVDISHVCMIQIENVKLKTGAYKIEGGGKKAKPIKVKDSLYPSPRIPNIPFTTSATIRTNMDIAKVLKHMTSIGDNLTMTADVKSQFVEISVSREGEEITSIISSDVKGDSAYSRYQISYLITVFKHLNPTSLEFGHNYPIKLEGKNWTFFLAPRIGDV